MNVIFARWPIPAKIRRRELCLVILLATVSFTIVDLFLFVRSGRPVFQDSMKSASWEDVEVIGIDSNSTLGRDISRILHWRQSSTIVVHIQPNAYCQNPVLRGRLSGPSLAIIEWSRTIVNNTTTELVGKYNSRTSGVHFVEIIALLCEKWDHDTDFTNICLEDPRRHRLTQWNANISVLGNASNEGNLGWWHLKDEYRQSKPVVPLYTRWQRKNCGPTATEYCPETGSLDRFQPYTFSWLDESFENRIRNDLLYDNATKLCHVGSSHSTQLHESTTRLFPAVNATRIYAKYPQQVTSRFIHDMLEQLRCNRIVIGIGQWPGSFDGGKPYLFPEYEETMTAMLLDIQNYTRHDRLTFFLRSVNYNPLGGIIASCLPKDWRSPVVIDGYNAILRRLADNFNMTFIDSNFIVGPMWDSAPDWCHYRNEVGDQMATYILAKILKLV